MSFFMAQRKQEVKLTALPALSLCQPVTPPANPPVFALLNLFLYLLFPLQVGVCLGPKLESLALPGSSITEASLLALLPRLTSLRRLDLRGLDSLFMSGAFLSREEHRQQVYSGALD